LTGFLFDSSAWIEYLRRTGSRTNIEVRRLLQERPQDVHVTEPVIMELLAGANTPRALADTEKLVSGLPLLSVDAHLDYRAAAATARASRQNGHPVRSIVDCLIAAVAVRTGAALVHRDRDYDHLAEILPDLRLHPG
jgi:predicted nucleic acid-binding protein